MHFFSFRFSAGFSSVRRGGDTAVLLAMRLCFAPFFSGKPTILVGAIRGRSPHRSPLMSTELVARTLSSRSLGVVITGSTKGVGRALAEEFVKRDDGVVITSRTPYLVDATVASLRRRYPTARIFGCVADVANHADVARLTDFAADNLGTLNTFICNAGTAGTRCPIRDAKPEDLQAVVGTNLLGPLYCAKEVCRVAKNQTDPLHVFIMDGSGTRGNSTAGYAAYGATKRSIPQLISSLSIESKSDPVRFHTLSPGMVLTDLLLGGSQERSAKKIFNFLAEEPETVAADLVPRIRSAVLSDKSKTYIQFLTIPKALYQLTTGFLLGFRKNKFFDVATGTRIAPSGRYTENGVRIKDD